MPPGERAFALLGSMEESSGGQISSPSYKIMRKNGSIFSKSFTTLQHLLQSFESLTPESGYELTHIVIAEGGMEEIWGLVADLGGHTLHLRMQNPYLSWVKLELDAEENGIQQLGI
ncbi:hypothetical protein GE09DRAFT_1222318 [Coniochaeta sp. 2T2.1]|nr:hypothetical protein GE09DRAFT_1222318 [Coniochaeta sp. 2T2.1]